MDFMELVRKRRSVRSFSGRDVPEDAVLSLLRAAQSAPSAGNCQPWHFYVIRDKAVQREIEDKGRASQFVASAPVMIVVCADIRRSAQRYHERGGDLYCIQDTAAAIQNILLCAESLGLGACWCGAFDEDAVSEILGLAKDMRPVAVIPVGYPLYTPVAQSRRPLDETVTFIGGASGAEGDNGTDERRKIEHADMGGTAFYDVNLGGGSFDNVNLYGVEISDANLAGGRIHDSNLSGLEIYDCKLDGMTVNGKPVADMLI